jgi:hypothetical protein
MQVVAAKVTASVCLATRATATPLVGRHASCGGQSYRHTPQLATLQNDKQQKTENDRSKSLWQPQEKVEPNSYLCPWVAER